MKKNITTVFLTLCGILAFSAGCSNDEGTTPPPVNTGQAPTNAAAVVTPPAADAEPAAAAKPAADQVAQAAAQELARLQAMVDTAKDLIGKGKYTEAMAIISELEKHPLSPEQQSVVDGLKKTAEEQAAKAATEKAAAGAASAVGGALGGN